MNIGLIIAGGVGERMQQSIPKQFLNVYNKPIIVYTLEAFQKCEVIDAIVIVSIDGWDAMIWAYAKQYGISKLRSIVKGGSCGQESIYNGIEEVTKLYNEEDVVLIHDAIRPMVSNKIISECIKTTKEKGNAITVIPCQEAMLETCDQMSSVSSYPRDNLKRTQTPQGFYLKDLMKMHRSARKMGITNSIATCTLAAELGIKLFFCAGSEKNLKITTMDDLDIFKALLQQQSSKGIEEDRR